MKTNKTTLRNKNKKSKQYKPHNEMFIDENKLLMEMAKSIYLSKLNINEKEFNIGLNKQNIENELNNKQDVIEKKVSKI